MTPTSLPPTYICPKCRHAFGEEAFITKTGRRARWCEDCRVSHRQRLISLNKKKLIKASFQEMAADVVAKEEGYADHPLAKLLALSHIAGAKRAVAIRDGRSWKGKKAWRAYFDAKRELEAALERLKEPPSMVFTLAPEYHWRVYSGPAEQPVFESALTELVNAATKRGIPSLNETLAALHRAQDAAVAGGTSEMSDEEIDAECDNNSDPPART